MEKKACLESRTIQTRLVLPADTNHIGTIFGGRVLAYVDEVAAIAAMKHACSTVVTASIDSVDFVSSAKIGDVLHVEGFVTYTGRTSMELFVKVTARNILENTEQLTAKSFLTMVAVDENGEPIPVPRVVPETAEEKQLFETAPKRRSSRLGRSQ